jgi:hypothetical protein
MDEMKAKVLSALMLPIQPNFDLKKSWQNDAELTKLV